MISSVQSQGKTQKTTGILEPQKKNLDEIFVITFSSSTLFLGVTQHHVFIELEREHPLANSKQPLCSVSRQRYSILHK